MDELLQSSMYDVALACCSKRFKGRGITRVFTMARYSMPTSWFFASHEY